MNPITVVFWLLIGLLVCALAIAGLLVVVFDFGAEIRELRVKLAAAREDARQAQAGQAATHAAAGRIRTELAEVRSDAWDQARTHAAERDVLIASLNSLRDRYEHLADLHAADRLLIDTFIPDKFSADDFKDLS
jgi:hypothetical protein